MNNMKELTISYATVEFVDSIICNAPMRTIEEIESCLKLRSVTEPALKAMDDHRHAKFEEMAVMVPLKNAGKGGGKVERNKKALQIPDERKQEYHQAYLEFTNKPCSLIVDDTTLAFIEECAEPSWLISRVERFKTAEGIDTITHMKVLMSLRKGLAEAQEYVEPEKTADASAQDTEVSGDVPAEGDDQKDTEAKA